MASISMEVVPNGDISPSSGTDSFMVIDPGMHGLPNGDMPYEMDESFVFGSLVQLPIDHLVDKVKDLSSENQRLKECMTESNVAVKSMSDRITNKFNALQEKKIQLKAQVEQLTAENHDLKNKLDESDVKLAEEKIVSEGLRREIELSAACDEEDNICDLKNSNESLISQLIGAKTALDELLSDMQQVQVLKSEAESKCDDLIIENTSLHEQLKKVKEITCKITKEKREVVQMNIKLEGELDEMRCLTDNLDKLPISLNPLNFPRLTDIQATHRQDDVSEESNPQPEALAGASEISSDNLSKSQRPESIINVGNADNEENDLYSLPPEYTTDAAHADCVDAAASNTEQEETTEIYSLPSEFTTDAAHADSDEAAASNTEQEETEIDCKLQLSTEEDYSVIPKDALQDNDSKAVLDDAPETSGKSSNLPESDVEEDLKNNDRLESVLQKNEAACVSTTSTASSTVEEVQRLLVDESLITVEGRRVLTAKLDLLMIEISEKEHNCLILESELERRRSSYETIVRGLGRKIGRLEHSAELGATNLNEQEKHVVDLHMKVEDMRQTIANYEDERINLLEEYQRLRAETKDKDTEVKSGPNSIELRDLKGQLDLGRRRSESLQKENSRIKEEKKTAEKTHKAIVDAKNEHTGMLTHDKALLVERVDFLVADVEKLKREHAILKKKCAREIDENSHLESVAQDQLERIEELNSALSRAQEKLDCITKERDQKMKELLVQEKRTNELCEEYHEHSSSDDKLEHVVAQKEVECDEYKEAIQSLNRERVTLVKELNDAKEQIELYKTQSEVYQKDFQDERQAREKDREENHKTQQQLLVLQQRLDINSRRENVPPVSPAYGSQYPQYNMQQPHPYHVQGYHADQAHHAGQAHHADQAHHANQAHNAGQGLPGEQPRVMRHECPLCLQAFPHLEALQRHVQNCYN